MDKRRLALTLATATLVAPTSPALAAPSAPNAGAATHPPHFVGRPHGRLFTSRPGVHGVRSFHVRAVDSLGLTSVRLIDVKVSGGIAHYYKLCHVHKCPHRVNRTFHFDTRNLENGVHVFYVELRGRRQQRAVAGGWLVSIYNPGRPGGYANLAVTVRHGRRHSRSLTVHYGQSGAVSGRLTNGAHQPIVSAAVDIYRQRRLFGPATKIATVFTTPEGRFLWPIPRGFSRAYSLTFTYLNTVIGAARVRINVRAGVRARPLHHTLTGKHRLTVTGVVLGHPRPASGLVVLLQAKHGGRWQTFASGHAGHDGHYRIRYRFIQRGFGRFKLRALVPRQAGYLYATGASRPFAVRLT